MCGVGGMREGERGTSYPFNQMWEYSPFFLSLYLSSLSLSRYNFVSPCCMCDLTELEGVGVREGVSYRDKNGTIYLPSIQIANIS